MRTVCPILISEIETSAPYVPTQRQSALGRCPLARPPAGTPCWCVVSSDRYGGWLLVNRHPLGSRHSLPCDGRSTRAPEVWPITRQLSRPGAATNRNSCAPTISTWPTTFRPERGGREWQEGAGSRQEPGRFAGAAGTAVAVLPSNVSAGIAQALASTAERDGPNLICLDTLVAR